jgi:hypothetical protein
MTAKRDKLRTFATYVYPRSETDANTKNRRFRLGENKKIRRPAADFFARSQ